MHRFPIENGKYQLEMSRVRASLLSLDALSCSPLAPPCSLTAHSRYPVLRKIDPLRVSRLAKLARSI